MSELQTLLQANPSKRPFVVFTVMLVAILEVLDSTIINVALPHMMSALNANQEQITWVLTSYVVASAVMLPLTGFLSRLFGEKNLLLFNTSFFMLSSLCCGLATSLGFIVFMRCIQGVFGAALIPLSQSFVRQSYPREKQGKAMAIWGMGVMVAPVLGPTLGGIITEHASWRWVFYINLPACITALILGSYCLPKISGKKIKIDWLGIFFMFVSISSLQLFLDQGNSKDWFDSNLILALAFAATVAMALFIYRSLSYKKPAINIRLFQERNFALSTICLALFSATQFSLLALEPILLQSVYHYTALNCGLALLPMGICSAISIGISSVFINRVKVKYILATGIMLCIFGSHYLSTMTLQAAKIDFLIANCILGFGMGFFMVPLSIYALANIPAKDITDGAGLFSYGRMLGTSIGISLMITLVTRETQINWNRLGSNINIYNNNLTRWLQYHHGSIHNAVTLSNLQQTLFAQSYFQAFIDAFHLASIIFLIMIPLIFLMKNVKLDKNAEIHH
jgi:MFS transporter, DHA2 family, multidrug resistance protein